VRGAPPRGVTTRVINHASSSQISRSLSLFARVLNRHKQKAMELMSEAENRAIDARFRLPTSSASRTAVVRLRALRTRGAGQRGLRAIRSSSPRALRPALEACA